MCHPLGWSECPNFYGVRGLRLCPSHWRGGLVYKGMDKGSFDDVTSFILRRHQINLCLSLLKIYVPSSSTSSSPSASSQRKSASQHTCSWSQLVWYAKQLTTRNGLFKFFFFLWVYYSCNVTSDKNARLLHCLIFRKDYWLSNPPSHILLRSERTVKADNVWRSVVKSALQ